MLSSCALNVFSQNFTDSNLPIVVINSGGQQVDSALNDIIVWMGVIDNGNGNRNHLTDSFNAYNGKITLNLRGSSKMFQPKKSYKISFIDSMNQDIERSVFGMPPENDWVLEGIYNDKSLIRNALTYELSRWMGHYSPRYQFVELIVDGEYRGIYGFTEKIKRDAYRVDISKLTNTEVSGDDLTGGYIFKLDHYYLPYDTGWYSSFTSNATADSANYFIYYYPKPGSMPQVQKDYLKNWVDHFESVLSSSWFASQDSGYLKYIDLNSFLDYFIINEMSRNTDGYRLSSYFFKDKDSKGGKLNCGPVWDYDLAYDNCVFSGGHNPSGWQYQQNYWDNYVPFWWRQLMNDTYFQFELRCRYQFFRSSVISDNFVFSKIDSLAQYLNESQARNFIRWPILGQVIYPAPSPAPNDYAGEVQVLKNWMNQRLTWLDGNIPGQCVVEFGNEDINKNSLTIFPNPVDGQEFSIFLRLGQNTSYRYKIFNLSGVLLSTENSKMLNSGVYTEKINLESLANGVYQLMIELNGECHYSRLIKQ